MEVNPNDTWEYVNGSWVRVETANAPSPRMLSAMAYDSGRGVTVLFGGYDGPWGVCATSAYTDTWEYDGTDWRRITTVHTPPQFVGGSMVYDESRGKIVLFTGWECQGFGWANEKQLDEITRLTFEINKHMMKFFAEVGLNLIDFKLEFGVFHGKVILADEWTPDTCRLWDVETSEKLDKDRFRRDLGGVLSAYKEVARRISSD